MSLGLRYDRSADALYIDLDHGAVRKNWPQLFDVEDSIVVDKDEHGRVVGIEVLGAAGHPIFGVLVPHANGEPVEHANIYYETRSGGPASDG